MPLETRKTVYGIKRPDAKFEIPIIETTDDSSVQVFRPTIPGVTDIIGQNMHVNENETVIDLGTGTGILAILAARLGAVKVYATDMQPAAVDIARRNVELNGVSDRIEVLEGSLFEPVKDVRADVIILDVSGLAGAVSDPWYKTGIPRAGRYGSELTIPAIEQSRYHLNKGGKIYVPTGTLTDEENIMASLERTFGRENIELVSLRRKVNTPNGETDRISYLPLHPDLMKTYERWRDLFEERKIKLFEYTKGMYQKLTEFNDRVRRAFFELKLVVATNVYEPQSRLA